MEVTLLTPAEGDTSGTLPRPRSPRAARADLTSYLGVVRDAHDAVGVVGRGGDFSRTARAVSAAKGN